MLKKLLRSTLTIYLDDALMRAQLTCHNNKNLRIIEATKEGELIMYRDIELGQSIWSLH